MTPQRLADLPGHKGSGEISTMCTLIVKGSVLYRLAEFKMTYK